MSRPLRIEFDDALYQVQVTSRGDRREPIVEDDEDRAPGRPALAEVAQCSGNATKRQRNMAMAQAYLKGAPSMQSVADAFGVHVSTVSRAVRQYKGAQPCNEASS